jgi:hypothetical protein
MFHARLSRDHLRLGALDFRGIGRGIDRHEEVAAIHERAFREMDRLDGARHPRAYVHALDRFEAPGKLVPQGHFAFLDGGDHHRHRLRSARIAARLGRGSAQADDARREDTERREGCDDDAAPGKRDRVHVVALTGHVDL